MVTEALTIGALLGKADSVYRLAGGSSIVFNYLRTYIFGKVLRTLEYPDGELISVKLHRSSLSRLRMLIAQAQPPPFPTAFITPDDVRQVALWTPPAFTEPIRTDTDVHSRLTDGSWVIWSKLKASEKPIPSKGIKLETFAVAEDAQNTPAKVAPPASTGNGTIGASGTKTSSTNAAEFSDHDRIMRIVKRRMEESSGRDELIDLAADSDQGLLALVRTFGREPEEEEEFLRHAGRLLIRRRMKPAPPRPDAKRPNLDVDSQNHLKRAISPQPELPNR